MQPKLFAYEQQLERAMRHYPVFLNLEGRRVLVLGDGDAAAAKLRLLAKTPVKLTVISNSPNDALRREIVLSRAEWRQRHFQPGDLENLALIFIAGSDARQNENIAQLARARGIPVNVVDNPAHCDFITPAIVDRDPITVAISSDGKAPALARHVKARIDALLPASLGSVARLAGTFRQVAHNLLPDPARRRRFWDKVFTSNDAFSHDRILRLLNSDAANSLPQGRVLLVGAGPGDPDLLTLKAHRALQQADVIVHDQLVSDAVLDFARRDAARIYVGKSRSHHSMAQDDINALLVRLAREGKLVVRLKGGDAFVFGRGGEELAALRASDIPVEVIPGITAAIGCAAEAGVPLTHRDHASVVSFVAGQRKGLEEQDWRGLAGVDRTLVIYMGLKSASLIAEKLITDGIAKTTPVVVIENGTRPESRRIRSHVGKLAQDIVKHDVTSPTLIIVGAVAQFADEKLGEAVADFTVAAVA